MIREYQSRQARVLLRSRPRPPRHTHTHRTHAAHTHTDRGGGGGLDGFDEIQRSKSVHHTITGMTRHLGTNKEEVGLVVGVVVR